MITKKKIITDFTVYYLRKDLCLVVVFDNLGSVQITHEELPVMGHGVTLDEAVMDFCDMFDIQYQGLVLYNQEDNLSRDAKRAKQVFLDIVEGVFMVNDRKYLHNVFRADEEITRKIPRQVAQKAIRKPKKKST